LILLAGIDDVELGAFQVQEGIQVEFSVKMDASHGESDHFMNGKHQHSLEGRFILGNNKRVNFFLIYAHISTRI
jgi:hypothetical protein